MSSSDDDDMLALYDLSAWDAPAPDADLADAVIARVRAEAGVPAAVGALETGGQPVRRRWWIAGGVAAALAASIALVTLGLTRAPHDGSGDIVATRAQLVELGPSHAQLDPGAEIHWRRDGHHVTVSQARGAVTWNVGGDDTFVIDAGATVASVEATGASLRVEVKMNASDARTIGAVAVTAAVVAMVTVVVYEGRVKIIHDGESVNVPAGSTLEMHATPDPVPVASEELDRLRKELTEMQAEIARSGGGSGPELERLRQEIADKDRQILALREQIEKIGAPTTKTVPAQACDEVSCVLENYEGACCEKYKKSAKKTPPPPTATKACDARALVKKGEDYLNIGMDQAALDAYEAAMACKPDPSLARFAFMSACRAKNEPAARKYFAQLPTSTTASIAQICVRAGIDLSSPPAAVTRRGTLELRSTPPARVLLDGSDLGNLTPMSLQATPGKHKVTYVIGENRYTWAVTIEAGKTVSLVKDLSNAPE